ncbi:hypothetical protein FB45DRAFT_46744 [Roridomyces roridus]|uniref:Uncharacterized protein n=1 Tax=Roridomyces roridus TaxID=1738132 RepID=A0AAD7BS39_9AGAR|nr:hypothetical protein FB45DRAFT_46744 [Roridomyces roridus]
MTTMSFSRYRCLTCVLMPTSVDTELCIADPNLTVTLTATTYLHQTSYTQYADRQIFRDIPIGFPALYRVNSIHSTFRCAKCRPETTELFLHPPWEMSQ